MWYARTQNLQFPTTPNNSFSIAETQNLRFSWRILIIALLGNVSFYEYDQQEGHHVLWNFPKHLR